MRFRRPGWIFVIALVTLSSCSLGDHGDSGRSPPTTVVTSDPALEDARTSFDTTRQAVIGELAAIPVAARALDGLDAQAGKGAFDPARRAQPASVKKAAAATAALRELHTSLPAYAAGIASLTAEAKDPNLSGVQADSLTALANAARQEQAAETALLAAESKGWDAYTHLAAAQALWITRAGAGYYPGNDNDLYDVMRAGEAYVVLVNPIRTALNAERKALAVQTASVNAARAATETSLTAAGTAFR